MLCTWEAKHLPTPTPTPMNHRTAQQRMHATTKPVTVATHHLYHLRIDTATARASRTSAWCWCKHRDRCTPWPRRWSEATPEVEEDTEGTPGHVASRPQGPSIMLTHATATRPKCQPTVQHRHNGVKVCRSLLHPWGACPPLLTPMLRESPRIAQKHTTLSTWSAQAATHQRRRCMPRGGGGRLADTQHTPSCPLSTGPKGPGVVHKSATSTTYHHHVATHHDDGIGNRMAPRAPPYTPVHRVKRPGRCAQTRDANCPIPNPCMPPPTNNLDVARPQQRLEGTTSTPHAHHPPGPKALVLRTSARCRSPNAWPRAPQPPMPTMVCNGHRYPGEPTPPLNHHPQGCKAQASCTSAWCQSREMANQWQRRRHTATTTATHAPCKGPQQHPLHYPIDRPTAQALHQRTDANRTHRTMTETAQWRWWRETTAAGPVARQQHDSAATRAHNRDRAVGWWRRATVKGYGETAWRRRHPTTWQRQRQWCDNDNGVRRCQGAQREGTAWQRCTRARRWRWARHNNNGNGNGVRRQWWRRQCPMACGSTEHCKDDNQRPTPSKPTTSLPLPTTSGLVPSLSMEIAQDFNTNLHFQPSIKGSMSLFTPILHPLSPVWGRVTLSFFDLLIHFLLH